MRAFPSVPAVFRSRAIPVVAGAWLVLFVASSGFAGLTATFVGGPVSGNTFPNDGENRLYDTKSVTVPIDPAITAWVAWNDLPTADRTSGSYTGCLGPGGFATDDFFNLTVTNPLGTQQTVQMDWNNASGVSAGPQAIIFGLVPDTPPVIRSNPGVFIEDGAFNALFTTAGNYTFKFDFYNDHSYNYGHGDAYLLVQIIPEPTMLTTLGLGLLMLSGTRSRIRR